MDLLFRGIVWFGLYVAIALAPLALALIADPIAYRRPFALELAVGAGFVAFALLLLELALVSRLRSVSAPFGSDVLVYLHRALGLAAGGFLLAHVAFALATGADPALLNPFRAALPAASGAIAFWASVVLVVTSLFRKRLRLNYEWWRRIHLGATLVLVLAALGHILALGSYSESPLVRGGVIALAAFFLALLLHYRVMRPLRLLRRPWVVVENRKVGGSTHSLTVAPAGHRGFAFQPGQFAWLITGRSPFSSQQHPITIASSAESAPDRRQDYGIKALGDWSRDIVPALAPGTRVWVEGPYGALTIDRAPAQGFILIAGGIGITPMRSILLTMRDRGDTRPCVLIYAANRRERVVYGDELDALEEAGQLELVYVFEQPDPEWRGESGYVSREVLARHLPAQHRHYQCFLCGPGPMMDFVARELIALGVPSARIHSERFDVV
jgi:predicted ferric reductase